MGKSKKNKAVNDNQKKVTYVTKDLQETGNQVIESSGRKNCREKEEIPVGLYHFEIKDSAFNGSAHRRGAHNKPFLTENICHTGRYFL